MRLRPKNNFLSLGFGQNMCFSGKFETSGEFQKNCYQNVTEIIFGFDQKLPDTPRESPEDEFLAVNFLAL